MEGRQKRAGTGTSECGGEEGEGSKLEGKKEGRREGRLGGGGGWRHQAG